MAKNSIPLRLSIRQLCEMKLQKKSTKNSNVHSSVKERQTFQ